MERSYVRPETIDALLEALETPGAAILCGGTDLMVKLRAGLVDPSLLVDISGLEALRGVRDEDGGIVIGAATPETELLENDAVRQRLPLLVAALETLGSVQIRNRGTLGGNLVNASPAADGALPLLLHDAEVVLASRGGVRRMPVEAFIVSPGKTQLRAGEFVQEIRIPAVDEEAVGRLHKVGRRRALTIAIASVGMLCRIREGRIAWIRLAAGSVAPRPIRLRPVEEALTGHVLDAELIPEARALAASAVSPIDDIRGTAEYRRGVVADLVAAFLSEICDA
ncbi:MAG: xanthine dehydrogenase family protein subunit M [Candidatus Bipolaricaulota bacterium]|nr:MAG: xanthine dehydrogenase family protein subunit M [Candidatus Bipolaricaulota bacterium]